MAFLTKAYIGNGIGAAFLFGGALETETVGSDVCVPKIPPSTAIEVLIAIVVIAASSISDEPYDLVLFEQRPISLMY